MSNQRHIDVQDGDPKWVEEFENDIRIVCGMIEEAFQENKALLLSPVMRELIRDRGRALKAKLDRVRNRLCVDNLGEPLNRGDT